jgi:SAM-dependent methyltransferase
MLPEPIYEFGSYQVAGQEQRAIRSLFTGRAYVGCDARPGPGVDRILDLERLALPDASVGTAIALDTFEHVKHIWTAVEELYRVLKPDGIVVLSSVMYFPIHDFPADYWRFTPAGLGLLTEGFGKTLVEFAGLRDFPHSVVVVAAKREFGEATEARLRAVLSEWKRQDAQGWKEIMTLILPPILLNPLYRAFTRLNAGRGHKC